MTMMPAHTDPFMKFHMTRKTASGTAVMKIRNLFIMRTR